MYIIVHVLYTIQHRTVRFNLSSYPPEKSSKSFRLMAVWLVK